MKKTLPLIILFGLGLNTYSQNETDKKDLFCGGMLLHYGYVSNTRTAQNISGPCHGIGGQISFFLGDNFRLGTEGYASTAKYKGTDGFCKLGWGGLMFGYQFNKPKITPVLSLTLGGGSIKDLYILQATTFDNNPDNVIYRVYSTMIISPSVNFEYSLTSIISIVTKFDYILNLSSNNNSNFASGPRTYIGVLFNK